jgi:adenylate cyclase
MTILFCDIKGFTGISEGMTPQGLVKLVNKYLSTISRPIREHEGVIDKYIGDAVMAFWGAPFTDDEVQARLASEAALDILELIEPLQAELPTLLGLRSLPAEFDLRIGVATGEVLVGSIGCELMMNYTVMGDTVNLAFRLEGANKVYGSRLLVSEPTVVGAGDAIETREIDKIVVRGQSRPHVVFEIMGRKGSLTEAQCELRDRFSEGLAAYRTRHWDDARRAFRAALQAVPGDGPSRALLSRVDQYEIVPRTIVGTPAGAWITNSGLDSDCCSPHACFYCVSSASALVLICRCFSRPTTRRAVSRLERVQLPP